jgi:hypothetical protein
MNKIPFIYTESSFSNIIRTCKSLDSCGSFLKSYTDICHNKLPQQPPTIPNPNPELYAYTKLIEDIKVHFKTIISLNNKSKIYKNDKDNKNIINKRYIYYDSLDIANQDNYKKKIINGLYFTAITMYIIVFILKKLYKKPIEFLYLIIVIASPFFSNKILDIINMFYKFNVMFLTN